MNMSSLQRAIKDGYVNISGNEGKRKITYVASENHSENFEDPEEKVRAEFYAELIYKYQYPANRIRVEATIPDRLPTDRADIVVFSDDACTRPYAVVECKKEGVTDAEFNQAIEQGVGNASWVKLRAEYVVIIAGGTRRVLEVSDEYGIFEREKNIVADLPKQYGKVQEYRFYKGTANDIRPVAREDLIAAIKKCHQTLWGGGRLSPPTAFGELCKLIFVFFVKLLYFFFHFFLFDRYVVFDFNFHLIIISEHNHIITHLYHILYYIYDVRQDRPWSGRRGWRSVICDRDDEIIIDQHITLFDQSLIFNNRFCFEGGINNSQCYNESDFNEEKPLVLEIGFLCFLCFHDSVI